MGLLGLGIAAALIVLVGSTPGTAFGGSYRVDALTTFLHLVFVAIAALTILFGPDYLAPRGLPVPEFAALLVFAIAGMMLVAASADLLVLFLGLELMVIPGYLLAGYHKRDALSTEGAVKYFLLGSFSSAIFLFGLAFVWGLTGSTRIGDVAGFLGRIVEGQTALSAGLAMGLAFLTTGVAFKIAAVPFHYWTPDAYQGSPTPITGYLSVGPKIGAFAVILRVFAEALGPLRDEWVIVFFVLAALTMTLGNLVALTQDNVKRMLAYSSIAHTGYMLVGLAAYAAGQIQGLEGLLFYSAAYSFMNLGAFAVIGALQKRPGVTSRLETFAGLGRREPVLGILMVLFLLSLTGIPPTAGFFAKAYVIIAARPGRRLADAPRRDRGPQRRGRRVLLPPGRRLHVHARAAGRADPGGPRGAPAPGAGDHGDRHGGAGALPGAPPRGRRGGREGDRGGAAVAPGRPARRGAATGRPRPTRRSSRLAGSCRGCGPSGRGRGRRAPRPARSPPCRSSSGRAGRGRPTSRRGFRRHPRPPES